MRLINIFGENKMTQNQEQNKKNAIAFYKNSI